MTLAPLAAVVMLAVQAFSGTTAVAATFPGLPETSGSLLADGAVAEPGDTPVLMVTVDEADFIDDAAALPPGLTDALARDTGLTGAEWMAQSEAANTGADVVAGLRGELTVVDARLEGYDLVVTVETQEDAQLVEAVGAVARIGTAVDRGIELIAGLLPAADLRGGVPYIFPDGSGTARCSIGFVGVNTATQKTEVISAGHCLGTAGSLRQAATSNSPTISGGSVSSPYTPIGNAGLHVTGQFANPGYSEDTYYDLGISRVSASGWTAKPEVVTWGGTSAGAPLASAPLTIRDAGPALRGSTICKSGATTGWTCGAITNVDVVLPVGGNGCATTGYCVGGIVANICVRPGDSGGPAMVGSRAVGVTSASDIGAGSCSLGGTGVFSSLYSSDPALEKVSKVWPSWEPRIGVQTPTVSLAGRVLSGVVANASPRHRVEVTLCGGDVLSSRVGQGGVWSVDATRSDKFPQTFTVRSVWGSGSFSTAVSGALPGTGLLCAAWDVLPDRAFANEITWLASSGITNGYSDGTFRPSGKVNRNAMAAFLYRFAGEPASMPPTASSFSDVTPTTPFYKEITWLNSTGITGGYGDGTFRPGQPVNRDAMAAFLYRFAGEPAFTPPRASPFTDVTPSTPFYKEITWLASTEITGGFSDGTFRPAQPVNRDAMAAFLYRFNERNLAAR
jgi:hypothetical protein